MLDHVGFPITDYKRSKAFYEKALVAGFNQFERIG